MKNEINKVSEIAWNIADLAAKISDTEHPEAPMASQVGMLSGILSMIPDTKENREFLQIALATLQKRL